LADEGSAFLLPSPRQARAQLARISSLGYLDKLVGAIGTNPFHG